LSNELRLHGFVDEVAAVRAFSRFYTGIIGLLDEGLLDTPHPLPEARVLFELAQQERTDVVDLRQALRVDGGYLSRLLARMEANGLLARERSATDGRRQTLRLTEAGRQAYTELNERSAAQIGEMLGPIDADRRHRLVRAMASIEAILSPAEPTPPSTVIIRPAGHGDYGWMVQRHGALYAREYGWDETFESLVARIVADFVDARHADPELAKRTAAWVAEVDGAPAGCILCTQKDDETAQLRLLLVDRSARGKGVGGKLVDECIRFARGAGYERMMLWTNSVLVEARRIYERAGFELVDEEPHHSFGHDLVGQNFALDLVTRTG